MEHHLVVRALLAAIVALSTIATATSVNSTMYVFGDIHMDPYYGTPLATDDNVTCQRSDLPPFPMKGCDSSIALMESAIKDIFEQASVDGNGIMLITGDFLRHRMVQFDLPDVVGPAKHAVEYEVARNITYLIGSTIKKYQNEYFNNRGRNMHVVVHPNYYSLVFGNEDCVPNYKFNSLYNASAHPALPHLVNGLLDSGIFSEEQAAAFSQCAYYSYAPEGTNLVIISINTIIYSKEKTGDQGNISDPCGQLAWLEEQLNAATINEKRVIMLGHIIPEATKWNASYLDAYKGLMESYRSVVSAQFFGHTHMFTFMADAAGHYPPLFDVPGITPRDGNMPAYLKVQFTDQGPGGATVNNSQWVVSQITQRFIDVSDQPASSALGWKTGSTFPTDFTTYPMSTQGLYNYAQYLLPKSHTSSHWLQFQQFYFGGVVLSELSKKHKTEVLCKATTFTESDYEKCKSDNK